MINKNYKNIKKNILYALINIWEWDKRYFFICIPKIVISLLLPILTAYLPKLVIDCVENYGLKEIVLVTIVFFFILFILEQIESFCESRIFTRQYKFSDQYQIMIREKYMRMDFSNTDSPEKNIKYQNAMGDACSGNCAAETVWNALMELLIAIFGIISYTTIIINISPLILLFIIFTSFVVYMIGRLQRRYIDKKQDEISYLNHKVEYFTGFSSRFDTAKDIRIYGMQNFLKSTLINLQTVKMMWETKKSFFSFISSCSEALLTFIRDALAYSLLISMFFANEVSIGDFVFLFNIIGGLANWLNGISGKINSVVEKGIRIGYYREYFDIEDHYNHDSGCSLPSKEELPVEICFSKVSYKYQTTEGDAYALKDVNLTIHKGESIAIVGKNGAGKTTLVKLLCGFYVPTEGNIYVNGKDITQYNIEDYYTLFSGVFQDIYLLPITIAEFVASSSEFVDEYKVNDVLNQAGLYDRIKTLPNGIHSKLMKGVYEDSIDLSGGEKQKLMLARALYKDAPILVLDEPTAALDPISENELYIKYNNYTKNKTSIFISHRLASTRFCDRIVYIEDGRVAEVGTHEELVALNGRYAEMFDTQRKYYKEVEGD